MAQPDAKKMVGTPEQLAGWLRQLPTQKRYRLVEEDEPATPEMALPDPGAAASIALLRSWIARAPTDPDAIREAEDDLREFKRHMNVPRQETEARLHYPDAQ